MLTFLALCAAALPYTPPSNPEQIRRFAEANKIVDDLYSDFHTCRNQGAETGKPAFTSWQATVEASATLLGAILPTVPTPQATLAADALNKVRMAGNRTFRSMSDHEGEGPWYETTQAALRDLRLAVALAIHTDPVFKAPGVRTAIKAGVSPSCNGGFMDRR